jgi:molecular chaperone DnaK
MPGNQEERDGESSRKLPLSVSIETQCGLALKIAEIGDPLPVKTAKVFSTGINIPDAVAIRLYAGERAFSADNMLIGEFKINDIKKLPDWRPVISLIIFIDKDCNISIKATDEGSLNSVEAEISGEWVPPQEEIIRMVREAQENSGKDFAEQNKVKLMQMAQESLCRSELRFKAIRKKLPFDKAVAYQQKLYKLKSRLKKIKTEDMTELLEKAISASIHELNLTIGAE